MIRKIFIAVMLAAGFSSSAFAQASFTVKDSASVTQTFKSFNCSATICSLTVPADITGAAFGTPANPFFMNTSVTLSANVLNTATVSPVFYTQPASIAGTVTISSNSAVQPTTVLNTVPTTVSGTVTISSTSAVQPVTVQNSVPIAGTVTITSTSALQPVTINGVGLTSNNLNVQCSNCSGSGVSTTDAAT